MASILSLNENEKKKRYKRGCQAAVWGCQAAEIECVIRKFGTFSYSASSSFLFLLRVTSFSFSGHDCKFSTVFPLLLLIPIFTKVSYGRTVFVSCLIRLWLLHTLLRLFFFSFFVHTKMTYNMCSHFSKTRKHSYRFIEIVTLECLITLCSLPPRCRRFYRPRSRRCFCFHFVHIIVP